MQTAPIGPRETLLVKHNYRVVSKGGWKVEIWTVASSISPEGSLDIDLRLTADDKTLKQPPKVTARLTAVREGGAAKPRETTFEPRLEELAVRAKGRKELTWGKGEGVASPPKRLPPGRARLRVRFDRRSLTRGQVAS